MLSYLQIRDFAIVDALELEFAAGMSAITGETGAGKSIMLDALGLLLGDRADADAVKTGAERAEISAHFDIARLPALRDWLSERDLDDGDGCHLRRLITVPGAGAGAAAGVRSRAYVNGVSQPLSTLRQVGERLVDIHGQHENQLLLKRDLQRRLLDDYAGHQSLLKPHQQRQLLDRYGGHQGLLDQLGATYRRWLALRRRLQQLQRSGGAQNARLELLQFQVRELDALGLGADELPALEAEHKRLAHADELLDGSQRALAQLYDNEEASAYALLSRWQAELHNLSRADRRLGAVAELLAAALIQVEEAGHGLRDALDAVDLDPERLQWLETRLGEIYSLARKHRVEPAELAAHAARLTHELDQLQNGEQHADAVAAEIEQALAEFHRDAKQLGALRRAAAAQLSRQVSESIRELGMPDGQFQAELVDTGQPAEYGLENVEFRVSANPGQPLRPLSKIASGGELSRISLAIHVIAADSAHIPTLIFDEVDTGIGGAVAEVVGRRLRELGASHQVLCVTHLPQVAAQAHQQFRVSKRANGAAAAEVTGLGAKQRVEEIARMLGGVKLTKNTLAHAREMIKRAQQ